jgi:glutamate dehydrogenase (NAD(P)+)
MEWKSMIPRQMREFLAARIPEPVWERRVVADGSRRYFELSTLDVELLHRIHVTVDHLGPRYMIAMWDEESDLEVGGYLVVDNMAMGSPSMGGVRMLDTITPLEIHNLARGMTLKNAAARLPYGGGKSGICADGGTLTAAEREEVVRRFAALLYRYRDIYNPGPDVGTSDADMKTIAIQNGLDNVVSKPVDMGGNRIDELGGAARGVVLSLKAVLKRFGRLTVLPQFRDLTIPEGRDVTVIIQGFGAVGAHTAKLLRELLTDNPPNIVGISDASGYVYSPVGVPTERFFRMWADRVVQDGTVSRPFIEEWIAKKKWDQPMSFSTDCNNLLREDAFCLIPAAPVPNYLDIDDATNPSMTVDRIGKWRLVIEGANTYSPDPERLHARRRMERAVYRDKGVLIVADHLVNSGGVVYAAHERIMPTPSHLAIPRHLLGNREAVDEWLHENRDGFAELSEKRRLAAEAKIQDVIEDNMEDLISGLEANRAWLPCEAAEAVSFKRISSNERELTVRDVMVPIPTVGPGTSAREAAKTLTDSGQRAVAVVSEDGTYLGVIRHREITRFVAADRDESATAESIMTTDVETVEPCLTVLQCIHKLDTFRAPAAPVCEGRSVLGMVTSDLLSTKAMFRLLEILDSHRIPD